MSYRREELVASLLAGAGSIWFVTVLYHEFHRAFQILPPTGGPTEIIGIAVLIWLHAKHRREVERRTPVFANFPESPLSQTKDSE